MFQSRGIQVSSCMYISHKEPQHLINLLDYMAQHYGALMTNVTTFSPKSNQLNVPMLNSTYVQS